MTSEVRFIVKFRVPPQIIFEAITNEEMISKYTQAKARFEKKIGGIVELYDGSIKGKIEEFEENKKIKLTWHPSNWSQEAHVQMTFKPKEGNETQITILIKDCPNRDASGQVIQKKTVEEGFKQQIFNKIEMFVGYPMNKDDESDSDLINIYNFII